MFELALTKNDPQYVMQPEPVGPAGLQFPIAFQRRGPKDNTRGVLHRGVLPEPPMYRPGQGDGRLTAVFVLDAILLRADCEAFLNYIDRATCSEASYLVAGQAYLSPAVKETVMQRMAELALIYEDHTFLMVHIQAGRDTFQRALPLRKVAEGLQAEKLGVPQATFFLSHELFNMAPLPVVPLHNTYLFNFSKQFIVNIEEALDVLPGPYSLEVADRIAHSGWLNFTEWLPFYLQKRIDGIHILGERNIAGLSANAKSACRILRKGIRLGLSYSSGTGAAQAAIGGAPAASAPALLTGGSSGGSTGRQGNLVPSTITQAGGGALSGSNKPTGMNPQERGGLSESSNHVNTGGVSSVGASGHKRRQEAAFTPAKMSEEHDVSDNLKSFFKWDEKAESYDYTSSGPAMLELTSRVKTEAPHLADKLAKWKGHVASNGEKWYKHPSGRTIWGVKNALGCLRREAGEAERGDDTVLASANKKMKL